MIDSNRVERKNGLIIYRLHDDENEVEENSTSVNIIPSNNFHSSYPNSLNTSHFHNNIPEISVDKVFDSMADDNPLHASRKKLTIVLDGANIGWGFGNDHFSVNGIILAQAYFEQKLRDDNREISMVTFIPSHYIRRKPHYTMKGSMGSNVLMETDDWEKLNHMMMTGLISLVPSGDDDDVYVITYARENNGFIVSNDMYADHIRSIENMATRRVMSQWLHDNRCGYAFVGPQEAKEFMLNPTSLLFSAIMSSTTIDLPHNQASIFQSVAPSFYYDNNGSSNNPTATSSSLPPPPLLLDITRLVVKPELQIQLPDIHALSSSITILASQQQMIELKHAILARAYSLLRRNYIWDSKRDVEFILTQLDSSCVEAIHILTNTNSSNTTI